MGGNHFELSFLWTRESRPLRKQSLSSPFQDSLSSNTFILQKTPKRYISRLFLKNFLIFPIKLLGSFHPTQLRISEFHLLQLLVHTTHSEHLARQEPNITLYIYIPTELHEKLAAINYVLEQEQIINKGQLKPAHSPSGCRPQAGAVGQYFKGI